MNYAPLFFLALAATASNLMCSEPAHQEPTQNPLDLKAFPIAIQSKIMHMIFDCKPSPEWITWLVERNATKHIKKSFKMATASGLTKDNMTYRITHFDEGFSTISLDTMTEYFEPEEVDIDCSHSYVTFRFNNQDTLTQVDNNHALLSRSNGSSVLLTVPKEIKIADIVDSAESMDGKIFAAASKHGFALWELPSGEHTHTSYCGEDASNGEIVALNPDTKSIVIRDQMNRIFVYDWQHENHGHMLFNGSRYSKVHCIAFPNTYTIICQKQKMAGAKQPWHIKKFEITDIRPQLSQLQPDQMRLLALIHKAVIINDNNRKAKQVKVNLTGNSRGIWHARQAFFALPENIKLLVKDYIQLPFLVKAQNKLKSIFG